MRRDFRDPPNVRSAEPHSIDRLVDELLDAACNLALIDDGKLDVGLTRVEAAILRLKRHLRPRRTPLFH